MRRFGATLLLALLSVAAPLRAQHDDAGLPAERRMPLSFQDGMPHDPERTYPGTGQLGIDLAVHVRPDPERGTVLIVAPIVSGEYAPSEQYAMGFRFPLFQNGDVTRLGNVAVGAHLVPLRRSTTVRVGVEVATPTAQMPDVASAEEAALERQGYAEARATRALVDSWLWRIEALGVAVPARVEHRHPSGVVLAVDAAAAVLLSPFDDGDPTHLALQLVPEAGLAGAVAHVGLRASLVALAFGQDAWQLAAHPFARFTFEDFFLTTQLTVALAGHGTGGDVGWAAHLGAGVLFGSQ